MSTSKEHWAILAFTRFILAFIVLSGHLYCLVSGGDDWTYFGLWFNQGSAVFGFLIISGYSIAASLEKSVEGFYIRRVIRIWPVYLLSICLALMATLIMGGRPNFSKRYNY